MKKQPGCKRGMLRILTKRQKKSELHWQNKLYPPGTKKIGNRKQKYIGILICTCEHIHTNTTYNPEVGSGTLTI